MTRYRVFYEDQGGVEVKQFGPHQLLCACVADCVATKMPWEVKNILDGQPKKSDSKLLEACKRHAKRDADEVIFALFDSDKIHIRLQISKRPIDELRVALESAIGSPKVRPFLLEHNMETLVEAAAGCLEPPVQKPIPKRHLERDKLLARAANASRSVRNCVEHAVPSFATLVEAVASALT
jgi:hypothetical protein